MDEQTALLLQELSASELAILAALSSHAPVIETEGEFVKFMEMVKGSLARYNLGFMVAVTGSSLRHPSLYKCINVGIPDSHLSLLSSCSSLGSQLFSLPVGIHVVRTDLLGQNLSRDFVSSMSDVVSSSCISYVGDAGSHKIFMYVVGVVADSPGRVKILLDKLWPAIKRLATLLLCPTDRMYELDDVDVKIWTMVIEGLSYSDIAVELCISRRTLTRRINKLLDKYKAKSPEEMVGILLRP